MKDMNGLLWLTSALEFDIGLVDASLEPVGSNGVWECCCGEVTRSNDCGESDTGF